MPKIYICGSVSATDQVENLKILSNFFDYFDGAIFTVNHDRGEDKDKAFLTTKILEEKKKEGVILHCDFVKLHYIPMTMFLQCGKIKNGDWVLSIDAQELPKEEWLEGLRDRVKQYDEEGITVMSWGRPYLFKFNDQMQYVGSTHCWPQPFTAGKQVSIIDQSKVVYDEGGVHFGDFLYNKKKLDDSVLLHSCKYMICYPITNETINQYGSFGEEVVHHEENIRRNVRSNLQEMGFDLSSLNDLIDFFKLVNVHDSKFPEDLKILVDSFDPLKTVYRYYILNQSREEILKNRYNWSFESFIKNGDIDQPIDNGYIGRRNQYNQKFGRPME